VSEIEKEKPSRGVRIGRIATLLAILALVGLGLQRWIATRGLESTDDAFVEGTFTYLAAEVQGRVVAVNVEEHERVKVGEVLVRLDDADARARVDRAQAEPPPCGPRPSAACWATRRPSTRPRPPWPRPSWGSTARR
jgi:multidrug resistance efflux pump